ncbi:OX2G protein, partial [Polyodon spathula]|nr:OX2G protein [Polyodon spathula]
MIGGYFRNVFTNSVSAKVITQGNITATLDQPLTIRCNVTIEAGTIVKQVRWQKNPDKSIASNNQNDNAVVSEEYRGRVNISLYKPQTSSITFSLITVTDEGCYTCLFDTYPEGEHHEKTCISITDRVKTEGIVTADVGQPVTLKCYYGIPKSVHQVRWKMLQNNKLEDLASYNIRFGDNVKHKFKDRFSIYPGLSNTAISIKTVTISDEACYLCEFDIFPHGAKNGSTCLIVYVLPKPELHLKRLQDGIQANCTASAKPAPEITWNIAGGNNTENVTTTSEMHPAGITLVVSSLFLQTSVSEDDIICVVQHPGLESPITVSMSDQGERCYIFQCVTFTVCGFQY